MLKRFTVSSNFMFGPAKGVFIWPVGIKECWQVECAAAICLLVLWQQVTAVLGL
jgi:hypothetical protein